MATLHPAVAWIESQAGVMADRVRMWSSINSGSANRAGIERVIDAVEPVLHGLADSVERVPMPETEVVDDAGQPQRTPTAPTLRARKRPGAPVQVLLVIHTDTVYGENHAFQAVNDRADGTMHGPGVADAKGGIAVMLTALEAFERVEPAQRDRVGWTVLLNPDEEIGAPASVALLHEEARRADVGLVYEPALPDGTLIAARKGSGNFAVVVRGRSAHAGRAFFEGRNAVVAAAGLAQRLAALTDGDTGTTVNVGKIAGGGANNVVPDLAVVRFNVRVADHAARESVERELQRVVAEAEALDGITAELHGRFNNPPKPLTPGIAALLEQLREAGSEVGVSFETQDSGGVCDGNKLASVGLAVVDTLGPIGGRIHSDEEYLDPASLVPRAQLTANLLRGYAAGLFDPPEKAAGPSG